MDYYHVHGEPTKVYRLGKYDDATNKKSSRPIKVKFECSEEQVEIMSRLKNRKDAPEHLKTISLSYDLSQEQRTELRCLVEKAKKDTKASKNSVFRVRGSPGNWTIREFKKTA